VSLFVWLLPFDLSGIGDPTSRYATAGIALRVSGALKPYHHNKVETPSVGKFSIIIGELFPDYTVLHRTPHTLRLPYKTKPLML
jgi:hypothetical protein